MTYFIYLIFFMAEAKVCFSVDDKFLSCHYSCLKFYSEFYNMSEEYVNNPNVHFIIIIIICLLISFLKC